MSESTRGVFVHSHYMVALKDAPTAILCSQIHYWYSPSKTGKSKLRVPKKGRIWIAKSGLEWSDETGLTHAQVKRGLEVLTRNGVIEKAVFRFNGAPTVHVRALKIQGAVLRAHEYLIPIVGGSQSQEPSPLAIGDESLALHNPPLATDAQSLTLTTQEISTETTQDSLASNDAGLPKEEIPKHDTEEKESYEIDVVVSTQDVKEDSLVSNLPKPINITAPREIWGQLTKQYFEEYGEYLPLGSRELGQLNQLFQKIGPRTESILRLLFLKWNGFAKHAKSNHGAFSIPTLPTIDFIVRNSQAALHYWILKCQEDDFVLPINPTSAVSQALPEKPLLVGASQPANKLPTGPQSVGNSPHCSNAVDVDAPPITLEELEADRLRRLAKRMANEELLKSKISSQPISSCLTSLVDEVAPKFGTLPLNSVAPELESTTVATVVDAIKYDDLEDMDEWDDWDDWDECEDSEL